MTAAPRARPRPPALDTAAARGGQEVTVGGRRLKLSNLDKVLYPEAGFTKGQVIDYYARIAPVLLPHLKDRPLTMKRYPNGVDGHFFYEKQCPAHRPEWVKTAAVYSKVNDADIHYCLCNDLPTLVWAANLADLELHTALHRARALDRPTVVAFDLDPGAPTDIVDCCDVALWLREVLDGFDLVGYPKTSGSKGMQVYVPLNGRATYDDTKAFAYAMARLLESRHPKRVLSAMAKDLRKGKVFVDWSQNDDHKTTVCVYSLRARPRPTVSTPLTWAEVESTAASRDGSALVFESDAVLARVAADGDLFADVATKKQKLPKLPG